MSFLLPPFLTMMMCFLLCLVGMVIPFVMAWITPPTIPTPTSKNKNTIHNKFFHPRSNNRFCQIFPSQTQQQLTSLSLVSSIPATTKTAPTCFVHKKWFGLYAKKKDDDIDDDEDVDFDWNDEDVDLELDEVEDEDEEEDEDDDMEMVLDDDNDDDEDEDEDEEEYDLFDEDDEGKKETKLHFKNPITKDL